MAKNPVITIYLKEDDPDYKKMLHDLKTAQVPGNTYQGRSESAIAKMLLEKELLREHQKICKQPPITKHRGRHSTEISQVTAE